MSTDAQAQFTIERASRMAAKLLEALHAGAFHRPGDETWSERAFSDVLNSPGCFCLLAVTDAVESPDPCGFAACRVRAQEAELLSLGVLPLYQGKGLATQLVQQCIDQCRRVGARDLFLEVAEDNPAAQKLYEGLGFDQVGSRKGYYHRLNGIQVDARTMRYGLE